MPKKPDPEEEQGFLRRWSRKKSESAGEQEVASPDFREIAVQSEPDEEPANAHIESETQPATAVEAEKPVLHDEDMPPLESLDESSDYSGFLSPGVSRELKRAAMRKLFAGAGFNIRDGLDDYDEDFRNFAPLGDIVTSDMKHQQEMADLREKQAREEQLAQNPDMAESEAAAPGEDELEQPEEEAEDEKGSDEADEKETGKLANADDKDDSARHS